MLLSVWTIAPGAQTPRPATQTIHSRIVADENGQPLANVRVIVRGTSTFTRSDLEGRFTLTGPAAPALVVTKAGYVRREIERAVPPEIRLTRSVAIAGRITNERGEPLSDIVVSVAPRETLDISLPVLPSATTDDRGEYRIGGLPPGTYVVSARSTGTRVVSVNVANGSRGAAIALGPAQFLTYFSDAGSADDAMPITLAAGDERQDVDFHIAAASADPNRDQLATMLRVMEDSRVTGVNQPAGTAAIGGTIMSSDGHPLPLAIVAIVQQAPRLFTRTTTADAAGAYRFTDLPAGPYRVTAAVPGYSMPTDAPPLAYNVIEDAGPEITLAEGDDRQSFNVIMQRWAAISGRILDESGEPVQGATVGVMVPRYQDGRRRLVVAKPQSRITDDHGAFRIFGVPAGQYVLAASVGDTRAVDLPGYAPTYFPGTGTAASAQFISINAGEDVGGIDVPLVAASTASIRGRVLDASGKPWAQMFFMVPRSAISARIGARLEPDGTFEFRNVAPGRYVIQADRGRQGSAVEGEFLAREVTIGSGDVTDLQLQASAGSRLAGRVTFESTTNAASPPPASISISPIPLDFDLAPKAIATTDPGKDYTFDLQGISGARRIQVTKLPRGWALKAILSNGRNVIDDILQFGRADQSLDDVEVVLSDRVNEIAGTVSDSRGRRAGSARIIAYSNDRSQWYPASRFISTVATFDGSYMLAGLPTGSYYVAAVPPTPPGDETWSDPAFLDSLRGSASVVTLGEGQQQALNLRLLAR